MFLKPKGYINKLLKYINERSFKIDDLSLSCPGLIDQKWRKSSFFTFRLCMFKRLWATKSKTLL